MAPDIPLKHLTSPNVAVITGADGALGQAVCAEFVARGWSVHACVRTERRRYDLVSMGVENVVITDVSDPDSVSAALSFLTAVDAVVHCAGGIKAGTTIDATSSAVFNDMVRTNVQTTFNVMHCTVPKLRVRGGTFISIGARSVSLPAPSMAAYTASKAAVTALTLSLAEEGRHDGIRAHVIVPGILKTPANLEWARDGEESGWIEPSAVAHTIHSLCSDSGRHLSGLTVPMLVPVDG
ncbi:MAG: SDR family NAD(P)-dependent oxidoreductase [Candidatus Kapaibacterium sp.]